MIKWRNQLVFETGLVGLHSFTRLIWFEWCRTQISANQPLFLSLRINETEWNEVEWMKQEREQKINWRRFWERMKWCCVQISESIWTPVKPQKRDWKDGSKHKRIKLRSLPCRVWFSHSNSNQAGKMPISGRGNKPLSLSAKVYFWSLFVFFSS